MTDLLFYGDTERSQAMRHELPVSIGDPFLLGIIGGRLHIMVSPLESSRIEAVAPDAVYHDLADLGFQELRESGLKMPELDLELVARAAAAMAVREAVVDTEMRVELAGILRAQAAGEAGLRAAADLLAEAVPAGEGLLHDGKPLTAEMVRAELREACRRSGAPAPPDVTVGSLWQGTGHDPGSGPLPADMRIVAACACLNQSSARRWSAPARRCGPESPAASCTPSRARCSSWPGFLRSAPIRGSTRRRASSSHSVTASGSPYTRIRHWVRPGTTRWWPGT